MKGDPVYALEVWAASTKYFIECFVRYWRDQQSSENFPDELPLGDWDEQFDLFMESEAGKAECEQIDLCREMVVGMSDVERQQLIRLAKRLGVDTQ
jgi:hypothetical protein